VAATDDDFDALVSRLDPAMVIVTTAQGGERSGCLVGFHSQSSIEPRRYSLWLSRANHTYRVALLASHLAVHALTVDDRGLAEHFGSMTGDAVDKFAGLDWTPGPAGVPLLDRCPHRMVVRRVTLVDDGGDHVCFVTEPVAAESGGPFTPMRLRDAADIDPGHPAEEGSAG
jgi:flavin reductase (DIM6/NTAB) family NADH-FMN oxidoreductase RutF